jgi:hypothetical protein
MPTAQYFPGRILGEREMSNPTAKILDALWEQITEARTGNDLDKAMADAMVRGAGYIRFTLEGIQHLPFDEVRIEPPTSRT